MIRAILFILLLASPALGLTTVTLRPWAIVGEGPVLVSDVAELSGDESDALGSLEIAADGAGVVRLEDVRRALEDAGVNWGRVTLRGGECRVREGALRLVRAEASIENEVAEYGVVDLTGPETPRTRIARTLGELYGVANEDLRIRFDASDAAFLDGLGPGARYELTVESASTSERAPVRVTVFDGERVAESRLVRADVEVRKDVIVLRRGAARGERLNADDLHAQSRWVAPGGSPVVSEMGGAIGRLARTRLGSGAILRDALLERPVLIRRNELATVHCLSGSVSMRVRARAESDGREGDVIEFRKDRASEPFRARVSGAGIAVSISDREDTE